MDILNGLSKVKRFEINVKSMLSNEKKGKIIPELGIYKFLVVKEILDKLKEDNGINQETIEQITQKYKV